MSWVVQAPSRDWRGDEKKLFTRVRRTLWEYEPLRASHAQILVDVSGHDVRLYGRVRTLPQKILAALFVERMDGVGSVTNDLIADPEVVRSVVDVLAQDARTAPYILRAEVRHGAAVLRGEVPSEDVKRAALDIASQAPLVGAVYDQLTISNDPLSPNALSRSSEAIPASPAALSAGYVVPAPTSA